MLISILINLCYLGLLVLASPVLIYRCVVLGKYREGWREKFLGQLPKRDTDRPLIWFHAVSVGEVLLLEPILAELQITHTECEILVSTTTHTGHAVAQEKYPDCRIAYCPLDFSWSVRRALKNVRPDLLVMVELELWPNLVREADRQNIPLVIVNGRLSEKSWRGYRRIRPLVENLLNRFSIIAVQSDEYARRFLDLGAAPNIVETTGSIKFDRVETDRENDRTRELRDFFGLRPDETVFIAGSTQAPEEEYALRAYDRLRQEFPELRLILVPRHKERFEEVAKLVRQKGFEIVRRSVSKLAGSRNSPSGELPADLSPADASSPEICADAPETCPVDLTKNLPVALLDTLGELGACWGLADIAFVGGSLTDRGGQNMIEPAACGAAVLLGPNTWNFRDVVALLTEGEAVRVVKSQEELTATIKQLLASPQTCQTLGKRARELVLTQQGATRRTLELLNNLIPVCKSAEKTFPGKPGQSGIKAA